MRDRQYGSDMLERARRIGEVFDAIEATEMNGYPFRLQAGALSLAWYRAGLPRLSIRLSDRPAGRMIRQHLAIRADGRWRYRSAQGALLLPPDFCDYIKGRQRQAVRTNVANARRANLVVASRTIADWAPGPEDSRVVHISPGPIERWMVTDQRGDIVADAILSVDAEVALLHGLVSSRSYARWMLHTAIVQRLCGRCTVLLTNSDDAWLLSAGTLHFQRLLGYRLSRLEIADEPRLGTPIASMVDRLRSVYRRPAVDWR